MASKKKAKAQDTASVRIDPALPLLVGNSVTFVADDRDGRVMAKVVMGGFSVLTAPSRNDGEVRITRIIERPGDVTVSFMENGKVYAEGSWTAS